MRIASYCLVSLLVFEFQTQGASDAQEERLRFFKRIAKVEKKMRHADVENILGAPGLACKKENSPFTLRDKSHEVWCYGTVGVERFPALGCVEFDRLGNVVEIIGGTGKPIAAKDLSELQIRELMALLHQLPTFSGTDFDPYEFQSAAMVFHHMGQHTTYDVIREYVRVAGYHANVPGVDLLLCYLHELPEDPREEFPVMRVGRPSPFKPDAVTAFRRFPIHCIDGIPILLVRGYAYAGETLSVESYLEDFEERGTRWRKDVIVVNGKTREQLQVALQEFRDSSDWYFGEAESRETRMPKMLNEQLDNFVTSRDKAKQEGR